jgi:rsbT co-antagonist protein RsbR
MSQRESRLGDVIQKQQPDILNDWLSLQLKGSASRPDLISEADLRKESGDFLAAFSKALREGDTDTRGTAWAGIRSQLTKLSASRAMQGFTPTETATFVFSLKQPLFERLSKGSTNAADVTADIWAVSEILDSLGLFTAETYQSARNEVISRQQQEMLELSTPVVTLWQGVLALPLIGTLDSARTQVVMESLLQRIVESGSLIAILDITGVPTVDTLVAQHLLKTVAAARLMGADCIISGIRPQIAQTIVHLGVDLNAVTTKATLADAFAVALKRLNLAVTKTAPQARNAAALAPGDAPQFG